MKKSIIIIIILSAVVLVAIIAVLAYQREKVIDENISLRVSLAIAEDYQKDWENLDKEYKTLKQTNKNILAQLDTTFLKKANDSLTVLIDSLDQKIIQVNKELALEKKKVNQPAATAGLPKKVGKVGSKGR